MAVSEKGGFGLPCGFSLLPSKEQTVYEFMLSKISEKVGTNRKLDTIVTDFESAMYNALMEMFPDVDHVGCQYHFRAAVWKNVCDKGLQSFFYNNALFQELIYTIYALAYVPVDDVISVYEEFIGPLAESYLNEDEGWANHATQLNNFGTYFVNTWIGAKNKTKSGSRRRPLFPLEMWNQYEESLADGISTNNALESFNRTWNSMLGPHPNIWKCITAMIKTEADTRRTIMSNAADQDMRDNTGRKEAAAALKHKIKCVVEQYYNLPTRAYLDQLAHLIAQKKIDD